MVIPSDSGQQFRTQQFVEQSAQRADILATQLPSEMARAQSQLLTQGHQRMEMQAKVAAVQSLDQLAMAKEQLRSAKLQNDAAEWEFRQIREQQEQGDYISDVELGRAFLQDPKNMGAHGLTYNIQTGTVEQMTPEAFEEYRKQGLQQPRQTSVHDVYQNMLKGLDEFDDEGRAKLNAAYQKAVQGNLSVEQFGGLLQQEGGAPPPPPPVGDDQAAAGVPSTPPIQTARAMQGFINQKLLRGEIPAGYAGRRMEIYRPMLMSLQAMAEEGQDAGNSLLAGWLDYNGIVTAEAGGTWENMLASSTNPVAFASWMTSELVRQGNDPELVRTSVMNMAEFLFRPFLEDRAYTDVMQGQSWSGVLHAIDQALQPR